MNIKIFKPKNKVFNFWQLRTGLGCSVFDSKATYIRTIFFVFFYSMLTFSNAFSLEMQFLLNIFNNAFSRYLILRVSLCQGTAEDPGRSRGNALAMPALKSSSKWHRTPSVLAFGRSWCCPCWKWSRDAAELPALTQGEAEKGGCRRKGPSQMHP